MDGPNLALDLLNTRGPIEGVETERLGTPSDLLAWLDARGLAQGRIASLQTSPAEVSVLLTEARRLRDELGRAVEAFRDRKGLSPDTVYGIDRLLRRGSVSRRLHVDGGGRATLVAEETGSPLAATLAPVALAAAELLTAADPRRVRRCASSDCAAWFVDTSKGGRRKWCSMATCGNRAKAAKHRRKRRAG